MAADEVEEFLLLEVGVEFHFVGGGFDPGVAEEELEFGDGHVGGADVADEAHARLERFHPGSPGVHVVVVDVGFGVGAAGRDVTVRRVEVGKGPVDEVEIEVVELEIAEGLFAGGDGVVVAVVPDLWR